MASISISIVGGGLAGCTLANGLMKHPHITFDVFEAKPSFSEIGWGVGLAENAIRALELIGPHMREMLSKAEAVVEEGTSLIMGCGPQAGTIILDLKPGSTRVHRARWLDALLEPVPKEHLHAGKKLIGIRSAGEREEGPYTLSFQDGTEHTTDVVIGADGIHSSVRKFVLGADNPASRPVFGGFHNARFAMPADEGARLFGNSIFNTEDPVATQFSLIGGPTFFIYSLMDDKRTCNIAAAWKATPQDYPDGAWRKPMDREYLEKALKDWESKFANTVVDSLMSSKIDLFAQWITPPTPTYSKGKVLIMGDAAHSTTPWQGAGAGLSVEDAAVLEALLGHVRTTEQVEKAFFVFDEARRDRCETVIRSSSAVGDISLDEQSTDPAYYRSKLTGLWDHIHTRDLTVDIAEAVERLG